METGFEFVEKNGSACVTKLLAPGASCAVPEKIGELPVTELSDRVFAGMAVEQVFLPSGLKRVGRYEFYGCEKLSELHLYSGTTEIGGGVLNGCRRLRDIHLHMLPDSGGKSGLRDFVTEINGRVTVHYYLPDSHGGEYEAARLVFPEFYDEAVENTPARLISFSIHGSGQRYRYCFENKRLLFEKYDRVFDYETIEETVAQAAEIALCRLRFPHGLREEARKQYEEFLKDHLGEVLASYLGDGENFKWLFRMFAEGGAGTVPELPLTEAALERLLTEASRRRLPEITGILTDYRHRHFKPKKSRFEF